MVLVSWFLHLLLPFETLHVRNTDWEVLLELALRRMRIELSMCGGEVSDNLSHATHLVVLSAPGSYVNFDSIFNSFSSAERGPLCSKRLHVVGYQWLEDSLEKDQKMQEEKYSLKPDGWEELNIEQSKSDFKAPHGLDNVESENITSPEKVEEKSRGRPVAEKHCILASLENGGRWRRGRPRIKNTERRATGFRRARQMRARLGNRRAKIDENESDNSASSNETTTKEDMTMARGSEGIGIGKQNGGNRVSRRPGNFDISHGTEEAEQATEASERKEMFYKAHTIELDGEKAGSSNMHVAEEKENISGKLEVMVDPVQAMLLDMIPSLGMTQVEGTISVVEDEKPRVDSDVEPLKKKKKVSYKDVAGELLKDW